MSAALAISPPEPAVRSVVAVVRRARAGLRAARVLECALFFATAALLASAAALLSGVADGAPGVVLLCGALAAASWWLEHPSPLVATARALDVSLRQQGALALAFELEQRAGAPMPGLSSPGLSQPGLSEMEQLVRHRVLARVGPSQALRALFPPLFLPVAAPAVAGLCLLLVLDQRRSPAEEASDLRALGAGLERVLAAPAAAEGGAEQALLREVQELCALLPASSASPRAAADESRATDAVQARLEDLDRRMAELAAGATTESAARLEQARTWLDALRTALAEGSGASADAAGDGSGRESLTGALRDGTISRPMAELSAAPTPAPALSAAPGLQAGNFWPAEYDAVVERWIELSRAAHSEHER